ncbi:glycoside hydrolase superfamily [Auriculariales sp. MPI-PUGE-AT-0066]|nr:glycoside hydrolase superfamily [Auriculariales sp. MPI-PUGE-AT-0066]
MPPPPRSLERMYLGPPGRNPLMFFEWNSADPARKAKQSWWKRFQTTLPELERLGFTLIWLPPPNKAMGKSGQGYDAYDLWDLGEFNQKGTVSTRWGTKAELQTAVAAAEKRNISVLIDAVLNHKMGADRTEKVQVVKVDQRNRLRTIGPVKEIVAWTGFDFPGRTRGPTSTIPSTMRWDARHFNGVDYTKGDTGIFRFHGKEWSHFVDLELGNYDYLLGVNIDHTNPDVREDLLRWGPWVLNTVSARGFRLDAIKHYDYTFTRDFLKTCRSTVSTDIFAVGEYWTGDANILEERLHRFEGTMALFDVSLHNNFFTASKATRESSIDLRKILLGSLTERCPADSVTFVDNHDTMPGQMLESFVDAKFKLIAYAMILLRPAGFPCVFYGDLFEDGRQYNPHVAEVLRKLILARLHHAYGANTDHFVSRNCIGWFREGDDAHPGGCAVVLATDYRNLSNKRAPTCVMYLGQSRSGQRFRLLFGEIESSDTSDVVVNSKGVGSFTSRGQVAVWVPASDAA